MEVTENKINSQDEDISKLSSKSDDQVKHELNRQESCFISSHSLKDYECYVPKYVKKRLIAEV